MIEGDISDLCYWGIRDCLIDDIGNVMLKIFVLILVILEVELGGL